MYTLNEGKGMRTKMKNYFNRLYKDGFEQFLKLLNKSVENNEKLFIVTANPETFMIAKNDKNFEKIILDNKVVVVPDGIGIVKASNHLGIKVKERIPGIEIAYQLLKIGDKLKKSIYIFGADEEVNKQLEKVIKKEYSNINLVGRENGYIQDRGLVFKKIKELEPDIILVALGIPSQEEIIYKYLEEFNKGVFVGLGGSFDVISGFKKRAPKLFRKLNLEWLYRIIVEPKRIKRFYNSNIKFILEVKKAKKND